MTAFPLETSRPRLRTAARSSTADPRWVRPALAGVLALAAALVLWNLTVNGYSNTYYASAAKAASVSWKAWFFGSLDPGSFITVDKPPLSLWLMGLSARVFGFSSFSLLLPQALCTIASVGVLYATVRRPFGAAAGLIAAAALAVTPVMVAVGRVNNPDALLILLLVGAAYLLVRALESGRTRHLAWCGAIVGLAFMTKMLQGWMIVPALAAAYLLAGPPRLATRLRQLGVAGAVMTAVSAAWPVAVSLWPGSAPYIGGSTDGSVWNLILGYNGFGRITGSGAGQGANFGGSAGLARMFNEQVGGQIAWLLPLAGVSVAAGLWLTRRAGRTDARRAAWVLFGVWALVHVAVFSSQKGVFHPYYTSALAPAAAALCGAGLATLWAWARRSWAGVVALHLGVLATAATAVALLARTSDFAPWLRIVIPAAAGVAVLGSLALRGGSRRIAAVTAVALVLAVSAGPAAYSVATAGRTLNGNNVTAGPAGASTAGMGGTAPSGTRPSAPPSGTTRTAASVGGGGGMGAGVSDTTIAYLKAHRGSAKYLVAATGSQSTAGIIIKTGLPVVTIGGFNGSDATPSAAQLAAMVAKGELHYVLLSSGGQSSSELTAWVKAHGTAVTTAGVSSGTLYRV